MDFAAAFAVLAGALISAIELYNSTINITRLDGLTFNISTIAYASITIAYASVTILYASITITIAYNLATIIVYSWTSFIDYSSIRVMSAIV